MYPQVHNLCLWRLLSRPAEGLPSFGALGHGRSDNLQAPFELKLDAEILEISAGGSHSGFLSKTGALFMTGDGSKG